MCVTVQGGHGFIICGRSEQLLKVSSGSQVVVVAKVAFYAIVLLDKHQPDCRFNKEV